MRAGILLALLLIPMAIAAPSIELTQDGAPLEYVKEGAIFPAMLTLTPSEGSKLAQVTSEQLDGPGGVRLVTEVCTKCQANVMVIGSQLLTFEVQEDVGGQIIANQVQYQLRVDGEPPTIQNVRIGKCTSGCAFSASQNTIKFSVADSQSGVTEDAIQVLANGNSIPFRCRDASQMLACEANITQHSNVDVEIHVTDRVTNQARREISLRYDNTAPTITREPAFITGSDDLPGGLDSTIRVLVQEPESASISLEAPFGDFPGRCERIDDETNSLECIVSFRPPNERETYEATLKIFDSAGNVEERRITLDVYESEETAEPNFWDYDTSTNPRLDIATWRVLPKTLVVELEMDAIQSTGAEPVSITAECTWPGVATGVIRAEPIAPERDPLLILKVDTPRQQDIDSEQYRNSVITCEIRTKTRIGSTIFTNPERDEITFQPALRRIPDARQQYIDTQERVQNKLDEDNRRLRSWQTTSTGLQQACGVGGAINTAVMLQLAAAQALQVIPGGQGASHALERSGDATDKARENLQKSLAGVCFLVTCDANSNPVWGGVFQEVTGSLQDYFDMPRTSPITDSAEGVQTDSGTVTTGVETGNLVSPGKSLASESEITDVPGTQPSFPSELAYTGDDIELAEFQWTRQNLVGSTLEGLGLQLDARDVLDPYRSKYVAYATACLPAIVSHKYVDLQTQCAYQECLKAAEHTGRSIRECQEDKEYRQCLINRGSVYFSIPFTSALDTVAGNVQTIVENPIPALVAPAASALCAFDLPGAGIACKILKAGEVADSLTQVTQEIQEQVLNVERVLGGSSDACSAAQSAEDFLNLKVSIPRQSYVDDCKAGYSVFNLDGKPVVGINGVVYERASGVVPSGAAITAEHISQSSGRLYPISDPDVRRAALDIHNECQEGIINIVEDYGDEFVALSQNNERIAGLRGEIVTHELNERTARDSALSAEHNPLANYKAETQEQIVARDRALRILTDAITAKANRDSEWDPGTSAGQHVVDGVKVDPEFLAAVEASGFTGDLDLSKVADEVNKMYSFQENKVATEALLEEAEEITKDGEALLRRRYMQGRLRQDFTQETFGAMLGFARTGQLIRSFGDYSPMHPSTSAGQAIQSFREGIQDGFGAFACSEAGMFNEAAALYGRSSGGINARISAISEREDVDGDIMYDYVIDLYLEVPQPAVAYPPGEEPTVRIVLDPPNGHYGEPMPLHGLMSRIGSGALGIRSERSFDEACIEFPGPLKDYFAITDNIDEDSHFLCTRIREAQ